MRRALPVLLGAVVPLAFTGVAQAAPDCPEPGWTETPTGTDAQSRGFWPPGCREWRFGF